MGKGEAVKALEGVRRRKTAREMARETAREMAREMARGGEGRAWNGVPPVSSSWSKIPADHQSALKE